MPAWSRVPGADELVPRPDRAPESNRRCLYPNPNLSSCRRPPVSKKAETFRPAWRWSSTISRVRKLLRQILVVLIGLLVEPPTGGSWTS